jgi:paraquat-inducible protein B
VSGAGLPRPDVAQQRRGWPSLAWALPLLALLVAGAVAWRHYAAMGPQIEIVLQDGGGVEAGATPIRYRDVDVGVVESVTLGDNLDQVIAVARIDPEIADALTETATFWLVRPVVSPSQIAGLDTLLSGVYFGVSFGEGGAPSRRFEALPEPPLTPPDAPGRRLQLVAQGGPALAPGSPLYFNSLEVGRVESRRLTEDGPEMVFDVFVNAPYDARIGPTTRFWSISGLDLELNAEGLAVRVDSLASLIRGGVAFDAIEGAAARDDSDRRRLYASRRAAEESVFDDAESGRLLYAVVFRQSVRGLSEGAPVEYRGVTVGAVESLSIAPGDTLDETSIVATLAIQPARIGLESMDESAQRDFFRRSVDRGLRVRLATGSLVTGALYVELVDVPDAPPAELDEGGPVPVLPSAPTQLDELRAQAESLLARAQALPVEELLASAIGALDAVTALVSDPDLRRSPAELAAVLETARGLASSIEQAGAGEEIVAALQAAGAAARSLETAAADLPALSNRLAGLVTTLQGVADSYGSGSTLNSEAVAALREVRQAARSVSTLAQTLERRPNSLILGR